MILDRSQLPGHSPIVMEEVTDPEELAKARVQDERFQRNLTWFNSQIPALYEAHKGKMVCISGEEVFGADTVQEAVAQAKAAHPDDDGRFTLYVPLEKMVRIYALQRPLAP